MGGFAVVIDWDRPVDPYATDPMMALVPHRATGGTRTQVTPHAVLTEGRTTHQVDGSPWEVATLGPLAIVGDIRLFDTGRLRAAAGGTAATDGFDDRQLVLAAYRRRGVGFLDAVDGDFAFVIWDDAERRVLAVRDRFAVKPIFYEETRTGIRFASEVKQLVTSSARHPRPDPTTVGEFVRYQMREADRTFYTGVRRIPAASALGATSTTSTRLAYWAPVTSAVRYEEPSTLPYLFREHLTAAVERRLRTSSSTVSQLSGGLDSSAIAASAATLAARGRSRDFRTIAAVYADPSIDESQWIDDIARGQPFDHLRFEPKPASLADYTADIGVADGPLIELIRDLNCETARLARSHGAELALSGDGGDEVTYQGTYLADIARSLSVSRFARDVASTARWRGTSIAGAIGPPLRQLTPSTLRTAIRALRRVTGSRDMPEADALTIAPRTPPPTHTVLPTPSSLTSSAIFDGLTAPISAWVHEFQSNVFARSGVDVSYPYFDRDLAEFVLSIDPLDLPYDGRSKVLLRRGYQSDLPASVLGRKFKTISDRYLDAVLAPLSRSYRSRYPEVPDTADSMVLPAAYEVLIRRFDRGELTEAGHLTLFHTWLAFTWLDEVNGDHATPP